MPILPPVTSSPSPGGTGAMPGLRLSVLGRVEIQEGGQHVTDLASRKVDALLIYLACTSHSHSREVLADLLWDGRSRQQAMANLRVLLSSLRQRLDPYVTITRQVVSFNQESHYWLDSAALESELAAARAGLRSGEATPEMMERMEAALELYEGDFLRGFYIRDGSGFDEWVVMERERLQRLAIEAFHTLMEDRARVGDYAAAVAHGVRLLHLDSLREETHVRLMQLLALGGQRQAALAQYESCKAILMEELGVEPTETTTALYQRIRDGQLASLPSSLPPVLSSLQLAIAPAGQRAEYAWLLQEWSRTLRGGARVTLLESERRTSVARLLDEVSRHVTETGGVAVQGRCHQFVGKVPYQLIGDLLRQLLEPAASALTRLAPVWVAELARLLPELLESAVPLPAIPPSGDETVRRRLFEAVTRFLEAITQPLGSGQRRPLVLVVEELQWADPASVDLLHYMLQRLRAYPLWLLASFRPDSSQRITLEPMEQALQSEGRWGMLRLEGRGAAE